MRVGFKITRGLLSRVRDDLNRPHPFAAERVGFLSCRIGALKPVGWVVLADSFHPVADEDYVRDGSVGAMMGAAAIRKALQVALSDEFGMFHVHLHEHHGAPRFSQVDLCETAKFVPDFWHVRPQAVHGAIVLSVDSIAGLCWHPQLSAPVPFSEFSIVGSPMWFLRRTNEGKV
jgi:hypothetical protein